MILIWYYFKWNTINLEISFSLKFIEEKASSDETSDKNLIISRTSRENWIQKKSVYPVRIGMFTFVEI